MNHILSDMKKIFIFFLSVIACCAYGQSVGFNNPTHAASALLDLPSASKGLLIPRVALTSTNMAGPVPGPVVSLLVYNTATAGVAPNNVLPGFYFWDGVRWIAMSGGTGGRDWSLTGNSGTVVGTHFIGTTDAEPLMFKVNNQQAGYLGNSSPWVTAFGYQALTSTTGSFNTAIGYQALFSNTSGTENVGIGKEALRSNISGFENVAIGTNALFDNTTGNNNTAIGDNALTNNINSHGNIAISTSAMANNTSASYNIAMGHAALFSQSFANGGTTYHAHNIAIGYTALYNTNPANGTNGSSGKENVALGHTALYENITGFRNTGIGTAANVTTGALSNATALGYLAFASASNYVRIGNTAVTAIFGAVGFNTSDGRFKTNVKENVPGLDFIMRLRPVTYHFEKLAYSRHLGETRDSINESELQRQDALGKVSTGFIAQEVEQLADSLGYDFDGLYKPQNDKDSYGIAYQQFVVPLIKAVQEQQKIIVEDRERITRLEKQNAELLKLVNKK